MRQAKKSKVIASTSAHDACQVRAAGKGDGGRIETQKETRVRGREGPVEVVLLRMDSVGARGERSPGHGVLPGLSVSNSFVIRAI